MCVQVSLKAEGAFLSFAFELFLFPSKQISKATAHAAVEQQPK